MSTEPEKRSDEETWAALAEAATPGPWEMFRYRTGGGRIHISGDDGRPRKLIADMDGEPDAVATVYNEADREFLFAARTAVPSLLAALAASRADNERLRTENRVIREAWDVTDAEFAASAARVEYARQALIVDGYFTEDEVGEDVAPRIVERLAAARVEVSQLRAKIERAEEAIGWYTRPVTGAIPDYEFGQRTAAAKIRAALAAEPLGSTPEQEQAK